MKHLHIIFQLWIDLHMTCAVSLHLWPILVIPQVPNLDLILKLTCGGCSMTELTARTQRPAAQSHMRNETEGCITLPRLDKLFPLQAASVSNSGGLYYTLCICEITVTSARGEAQALWQGTSCVGDS